MSSRCQRKNWAVFSRAAGPWLLAGLLAVRAGGAEADDGGPGARALLARWLEAIGGASAIAQLRSADYQSEISFGPGLPRIDTYIQATSEGNYRYEYKLPAFGLLVEAYNGKFAWENNQALGFGLLSRPEHEQNMAGVDFRAPLRIETDFPKKARRADEIVDGRRLQVLELTDRSGATGKWYFDPTTRLRVRMEIATASGPVVIDYSDFRTVQGVQEPFHTVRRAGGKEIAVTRHSVLFNEFEEPDLFVPPRTALEDFNETSRVFDRYSRVAGAAALRRVQTRVTRETIEITTSHLRIPTTVYQKRPNLLVMKEDVPGLGASWEGYDGHTGWAWSELQGYRTMKGAELQQMLGTANLDGPLRLAESCPMRRLLDEKVEKGRRLAGVALASIQGPAGNFYFDADTGELVRAESLVQAGADGQLKVVVDFADFRPVDGVMIPFVTTMTNPAIQSVMRIESISQNEPLADGLFAPQKGD